MFDIEVIVSIAILLAVGWAVWKGGQANPETNRAVLGRVSRLTGRVEAIEQNLAHLCKREDLAAISGKIDVLEEHSASSGDINALEGKVNAMDATVDGKLAVLEGKVNVLGERIEGWGGATRRVEMMVQRIEGILVKRALSDD